MPTEKFDRDTQLFNFAGLDLNRPVDSVKSGKLPYARNIRSYLAGRIEPREGLTDIDEVVSGQSNVRSGRRLNDIANSTWTRVIGTGTHLAYGQASFTDVDSGYSGDPLALIPYKPRNSPNSFMYVADSLRMRKLTVAGALHTIGLPAPATAPAVALTDVPQYKSVDALDVTTGWAAAGTAGAPATTTRINTTISQILFDSGTTGWACINPASGANIGPGCRIIVNSGGGTRETIVAQAVFPGSVATTISRIIYDSGTTGLCSLVLTTAIDQAACDALIRNTSTGPENARIVSVTKGPDNSTSIRLSTTGTWAAGDTVQIIVSFRAYCTVTHAAAETLTRDAVRTAVTSGTGTLTKTSALDLSLLTTGVPVHPDDFMHIGIRVSDPTVITELKVLLDVDSGTNDFTRNYYWRSFRASDLTPAASNLQSLLSTRQQILQRTILDTPISNPDTSPSAGLGDPLNSGGLSNQDVVDQEAAAAQASAQQQQDAQTQVDQLDLAISQQLDSGVSQFVELRFNISDLIRVGSDTSRTLQNVAVIRIVAIVTGNVNVDSSDWYISGGYGPDTFAPTASGYYYRYRARNIATNVPSNFSPASRYTANPLRQSVTVSPSQYAAPSGTSLTTADFVLDIDRFGGEIADWHYVGTIPNAASPTFADIYDDSVVGGQPLQDNNNYQPWPIKGIPVTGTTGNVAGTTINDSGTTFNVSWAPGTRILINNQPYTIYKILSTSRLELVQNAGSQTAVQWQVPEPTILAQPLPCLWESDNQFFACGDPINPGRLYYSNPDSETTTSSNYLDVTSPSEPLMNGVEYNVRVFLWSSDEFFQILKTGNTDVPFRAEKIPGGKGLFSRWMVTLGPTPILCFGGKDGIYATTGGTPSSLTDADMYPLFPNEGNTGVDVNGIAAPAITSANASVLRLYYYDEYLYFDYPGATLILSMDLGGGGWMWDTYTPNLQFHFGDEGAGTHGLFCGGGNGHLYQYVGNSDDGTDIFCEITTPSLDQGDPRSNKLYGDIMLDSDTSSVNVTAQSYFNNNATSGTAKTYSNSSRDLETIPVGSTWNTSRNISLYLFWNVSSANRPFFYIWEPRWTFESAPIAAISWEISPTTFGTSNFKHMGLVRIGHVSLNDLLLTVNIDGVNQSPITVTNSGGAYQETIFRVPVYKGKMWKLTLAASDGLTNWRLDTRATSFDIKNWGSDGQYNRVRAFGDFSYVEG